MIRPTHLWWRGPGGGVTRGVHYVRTVKQRGGGEGGKEARIKRRNRDGRKLSKAINMKLGGQRRGESSLFIPLEVEAVRPAATFGRVRDGRRARRVPLRAGDQRAHDGAGAGGIRSRRPVQTILLVAGPQTAALRPQLPRGGGERGDVDGKERGLGWRWFDVDQHH